MGVGEGGEDDGPPLFDTDVGAIITVKMGPLFHCSTKAK